MPFEGGLGHVNSAVIVITFGITTFNKNVCCADGARVMFPTKLVFVVLLTGAA